MPNLGRVNSDFLDWPYQTSKDALPMSVSNTSQISTGNRILAALSRQQYPLLFSNLHTVSLPRGEVLYALGDRIPHAFFPVSGMISLVAITQDGSPLT